MTLLIRPLFRRAMQNHRVQLVVAGFLSLLVFLIVVAVYIGTATYTHYDVMFACRLSPFTNSPTEYCSALYYQDGNDSAIQHELALRKIIPVNLQSSCYSDDSAICAFVDEIFDYGHVYPVNWASMIMVLILCGTFIMWFVSWWTSPHEHKHKIRTLRLILGSTLALSLVMLFGVLVFSFQSINMKHILLTINHRSEVVGIMNEEAIRINSQPYYNEAFRTVFQGEVLTVYEYEPTCVITLVAYQGIAPTGRQFGGGRIFYKMELQPNNTWNSTGFENITSQRHTIFPQPPELTCDTST